MTRAVPSVKLIMGILASSPEYLEEAHGVIEAHFGAVDLESEAIPFTFTDYYDEEMGGAITRQFVSFERLIDPGRLREIKILTNELEAARCVAGNRVMNLDPGYLTVYSVVLASTKEGSQRVYLGDGIYGQPMLMMRGGVFEAFEFTYPDYGDEMTRSFFLRVRERYREQLKGS